jgi:hypothetical protein
MTRTSFGFLFMAIMFAGVTLDERVLADDLSGVYFGGNFGRARNSYDTGFIDSQIANGAASAGDTVTDTAKSVQKMSDAWWLDAGYFVTRYFGVEASFLHIGEIRYLTVGTLNGSGGGQPINSTTEVTSHGPALSMVLRLPLAEAFEADLRLGDYFGKATLDNNITVDTHSAFTASSKSSSSLLAGVGASYTLDGHWSIRVDYLRINKAGDSDTVGTFSVNMATAGVSFTF